MRSLIPLPFNTYQFTSFPVHIRLAILSYVESVLSVTISPTMLVLCVCGGVGGWGGGGGGRVMRKLLKEAS